MKRFIIKTTIFLLSVLIPLIALEYTVRQIPNDYKLKQAYWKKNASHIRNLILGSSHSFFGVDPQYFNKNTFNASHVSQSISYDYKILMKNKENLTNLETLYIPISYFTLWGKMEDGIESWRCHQYVLYYGTKANKLADYFELMNSKLGSSIMNAAKYVFGDYSEVRCTKLGWGTTNKSQNARDLYETGKSTASLHSFNIESEKYQKIYLENTTVLNEIIKWCQQNKTQVVLFTPPAFKSYRDLLAPAQLSRTKNFAQQMATDYPNCIYVDLMGDPSFVAGDYYDADHLSEIGAEKLSKKLNSLAGAVPNLASTK